MVTLIAGDHGTEKLIVLCSVILSFQLPFALIPLIKFCGSESLLGPLAVGKTTLLGLAALGAAVVVANIYLVARTPTQHQHSLTHLLCGHSLPRMLCL